jgi:hypothetical protein
LLLQVAEPRAEHGAQPEHQRCKGHVPDDNHRLIIIAGLQDLRFAELDAITARVLAALETGEPPDAIALTFLLRRYLATDRADLRERLGAALAHALTHAAEEPSIAGRAAWLTLFAEVAAVADDERIAAAAADLLGSLRAAWPRTTHVDEASASVEACLRAAALGDPQELVPAAIDHLEHVVGGAYQPGQGVRGSAADQVRAASALLTAFEVTGRLPYSMLAEELMQIARREPWPDTDLIGQCGAARVLCRLASLHDDDGYRGAAVIAAGADYRGDAARILAAQSPRAHAAPASHAAAYGLALLDLLQ